MRTLYGFLSPIGTYFSHQGTLKLKLMLYSNSIIKYGFMICGDEKRSNIYLMCYAKCGRCTAC